jgi:glyoxylate/hydroxypyruvate reductase
MNSIIAFVARLSSDDTKAWINALHHSMPNERIVPFAELSTAERATLRMAIVANPDPAELDQLPALEWVQSLWAGVERLTMAWSNNAVGIVRLIDPQLAATMAEAVLVATLYLHRDIPTYAAQQRARVWQPLPLRLPQDRRVAILGLGHLGRAAADVICRAGFDVEGWSRTPKAIDNIKTFDGSDGLNKILADADIIVCLLPLTPETTGLLNHTRFSNCKPKAALINFGRGAVINTPDLLAALNSGKLSHAVLDVFDVEPLPVDSPLWAHEKITVLPHISAPTNRQSAAKVVAENMARYRLHGNAGIAAQFVNRLNGY